MLLLKFRGTLLTQAPSLRCLSSSSAPSSPPPPARKFERALRRLRRASPALDADPPPSESFALTYDGGSVSRQTAEAVARFMRCLTSRAVLETLEAAPEEAVTPAAAVFALKRVAALEQGVKRRRKAGSFTVAAAEDNDFLRAALLGHLVDTIQSSADPDVVIAGARVLTENPDVGVSPDFLRAAIVDAVAVGRFDLGQVCRAAEVLIGSGSDGRADSQQEDQGELSGLLCEALIWKIEELRPYVVRELFDCLPLLIPNEKRRVLTDIVEKRLSEFLEICTASDVLSVLRALAYGGVNSDKLKDESSRWLAQNMGSIDERETAAALYCLADMRHVDRNLIQAMERHCKGRGINDLELAAAAAEYCLRMQLRSAPVLDAVAEFVVGRRERLHLDDLDQFTAIARVFGEQNMQPANGFKFWSAVESAMERNLDGFSAAEIVDVLLSFAFLGHYPDNESEIAKRVIYDPDFVERVSVRKEDWEKFQLLRGCYQSEKGAQLPKMRKPPSEHSDVDDADLRVVFAADVVSQVLSKLAASLGRSVAKNVSLPGFPKHPLCSADVVVYPSSANAILRSMIWRQQPESMATAVLIRLPGLHFTKGGGGGEEARILSGAEGLRKRLLEAAGFRVVELDYGELSVPGQRLRDRLRELCL